MRRSAEKGASGKQRAASKERARLDQARAAVEAAVAELEAAQRAEQEATAIAKESAAEVRCVAAPVGPSRSWKWAKQVSMLYCMLLWNRIWCNGFSPSDVVVQRAGESNGWRQMIDMRGEIDTEGLFGQPSVPFLWGSFWFTWFARNCTLTKCSDRRYMVIKAYFETTYRLPR